MSNEAERAVLGAVLLESDLAAITNLVEREFYRAAHQKIWSAIGRMQTAGTKVDPLTLSEELTTCGDIEAVGGRAYISGLTDDVPTTANLEHYAGIVRDKAHRRRILAACIDAQARIQRDAIADIVAGLSNVMRDGAGSGSMREMNALELMDRIEFYQYHSDALVNMKFHGLKPYRPGRDELVVIAGRPGMGKSALMIQLAENLAELGRPVLVLSAEMSAETCQIRRLSRYTGIPYQHLTEKQSLTDAEWGRVSDALCKIKAAPIRVVSGVFSLEAIRAQIALDVAKRGTQAVFIDHLGKIRLPASRQRLDVEIGNVTAGLADEAKHHQIPIFLLHQLSRKNEEREDKRPQVTDLRDSGRIEQDADDIWLIYRAEKYDVRADDIFEIHAAKVRNGPEGTAYLHYNKANGRFWDKETDYEV
jgi:replicative DNA helicase